MRLRIHMLLGFLCFSSILLFSSSSRAQLYSGALYGQVKIERPPRGSGNFVPQEDVAVWVDTTECGITNADLTDANGNYLLVVPAPVGTVLNAQYPARGEPSCPHESSPC